MVLVVGVAAVAWPSAHSTPQVHQTPATQATHHAGAARAASGTVVLTRGAVPSIEAGVESWPLPAPVSREVVVSTGRTLQVLGGLNTAGNSVATVTGLDPATGTATALPKLATAVHDASGANLGSRIAIFGGGSPDTVAAVQTVATTPSAPATSTPPATALPEPRSDSAAVTLPGAPATTYIVGGYTGATYLPQVLATTNGSSYHAVATLPVPVRYPAVVGLGGRIFTFGGQVAAAGAATVATTAIQMVDPATGRASVVGHLPQAMYGAAAFVLGGHIYVAGGQVPGGPTLTTIDVFTPANGHYVPAGLLPQAVAFGGYTTVGTGDGAIGYLVGGEVASQSGPLQAGIASGTLSTVLSLRLSAYGGAAGTASSGSPFTGTLLIADRGNNRLIAINPARTQTWGYPSATMPPPPGGFYFPDDSFFIHGGTGIISNQEDNHTIVEIGYPSGKLLWQYGHPGVTGSAPGYLNQPDDAYLLKSGIVSVADASNNRILFMSPQGTVTGQIGNGADAHNPPKSIAYPNGDTPLANGDFLVSEINGSWIDEYTPTGALVWTVQMPSVNYPSDPQQLEKDLYLMTDYNPPGDGRVLTFTKEGQTVWSYTAHTGDGMLKKPSLAERLSNGLIMVNDDYRNRLVIIDPATNSIVWQFGLTDVSGTGPGLLSIPDGFDILLADGTTPTHPQTG